jgi:CheY-like chemotaxis protein
MTAEFLKRRGVVLTLANHGKEALERVKDEVPDAVLMDLHMPVMDGLEATRLIHELPQGKSLPIIAMTAAVLPEDRARCAAAGMVDFIAKPIDPDDLVRALLKWVKPGRRPALSGTGNAVEPTGGNLPASVPGFDLEKALRRLEGNRDLLARLLLDFAAEHPGTPARLEALLQAGNKAQAVDLLHTLKGVAANLGAAALAEAARQLEQEIKAGAEPSATQGLTGALDAALGAIRTHIAPVRPGSGAPSVDRAQLTEVLNRLVPFLQEQELIPVELMDSLRDLAQADFPDKSLARLIRQVDHFDHEGALSSVVQLAALHGVILQ